MNRAVLETWHGNYEDAAAHISKAQSEVYNELQVRLRPDGTRAQQIANKVFRELTGTNSIFRLFG